MVNQLLLRCGGVVVASGVVIVLVDDKTSRKKVSNAINVNVS